VLIVDGSNVPSPFRPWHSAPGSGRRQLVADVARLTRDWECCADVVFDGYPGSGLRQGELVATVRVWFSGWQPADVCIAAQSHGHAPGSLFVVTSDRELARRVRALGAQVISSDGLRRALDIVCAAAHRGTAHPPLLMRHPQGLLALDASIR
jgi:predicted RNA-binding protein with PIN domain